MRTLRLSAAIWLGPEDFHSDYLRSVGAPDWHGRNLDAIADSLRGGINRINPPFRLEILDTAGLAPDTHGFLGAIARVFTETGKTEEAAIDFHLS